MTLRMKNCNIFVLAHIQEDMKQPCEVRGGGVQKTKALSFSPLSFLPVLSLSTHPLASQHVAIDKPCATDVFGTQTQHKTYTEV